MASWSLKVNIGIFTRYARQKYVNIKGCIVFISSIFVLDIIHLSLLGEFPDGKSIGKTVLWYLMPIIIYQDEDPTWDKKLTVHEIWSCVLSEHILAETQDLVFAGNSRARNKIKYFGFL